MIKLSVKELEEAFSKRIVKNIRVLGVDTATRSGWCRIVTTKTHVTFTYGFIDVEAKDANHKYRQMIDLFQMLINDVTKVVIEDTFLRFNPKVFKILSRMGGFVYAISHLKGITDVSYITPSESRSYLGFTSKAKKEVIHKEFHAKLPQLKITDPDIVDSIIVAMSGIFKEPQIEV